MLDGMGNIMVALLHPKLFLYHLLGFLYLVSKVGSQSQGTSLIDMTTKAMLDPKSKIANSQMLTLPQYTLEEKRPEFILKTIGKCDTEIKNIIQIKKYRIKNAILFWTVSGGEKYALELEAQMNQWKRFGKG